MTILSLGGCAVFAKPSPPHYNLTFDADAQVNTMADGQPAPIKIHVLMLRSDNEFIGADFFSLQKNPQDTLGDKLLDSNQFFLTPGQTGKNFKGQSAPEARYIGVVAEYQNLDGKVWRISLPLPDATKDNFYKIWPFAHDELTAHIVVIVDGIQIVKEAD
ncbi:type VI secretion system lipoprotein TssJ [Brucella gallinifaecis]|uniref:type VI secretion system lipoprotein TssJ n=1 Tax=Brucella gallinifaecis TaxID=215590 RepID=UPI001AEF164C|nr:type VI secretion system lipoprotein TssJ [Brucella gallinifaecis]